MRFYDALAESIKIKCSEGGTVLATEALLEGVDVVVYGGTLVKLGGPGGVSEHVSDDVVVYVGKKLDVGIGPRSLGDSMDGLVYHPLGCGATRAVAVMADPVRASEAVLVLWGNAVAKPAHPDTSLQNEFDSKIHTINKI